VRLSLVDGTRPWVHLGPELGKRERGRAEARARELAQHAKNTRAVRLGRRVAAEAFLPDETLEAWSLRWLAHRKEQGKASVRDDEGRLSKYVLPLLGTVRIAAVTRDHVETLVATLDEKVRSGECAWKTARNVWTLVRKAFSDACRSKRVHGLRCRDTNPCADVEGPSTGVEKAKTYLYPSELLQLVESPRTPLRWKRLFALASYLCLRAGELEALTVEDLDLVHGTVHVHRQVRRASGAARAEGPTKADNCGRIPIEPELVPLLEQLVAERRKGRLVAMPGPKELARGLRKYLQWAGCARAELFARDETRKPITFHDLRATGITWAAVRGDSPLKIQARARHEVFETTLGYVREAEVRRDGFGQVFPPLPACVLGPRGGAPGESSENRPIGSGGDLESAVEQAENEGRPQRESKPLAAARCVPNRCETARIGQLSLPLDTSHDVSVPSRDDSGTIPGAPAAPPEAPRPATARAVEDPVAGLVDDLVRAIPALVSTGRLVELDVVVAALKRLAPAAQVAPPVVEEPATPAAPTARGDP
jgi:integrase